MKLSEVGELLAQIALSDNRIVGEMNVRAWHDVLPEWLTLVDAKDAVRDHRRTSTDYLTEAHIIRYANALRAERRRNAPIMEIPDGLHQAQERAWILTFWDSVKRGDTDPHRAADAVFRVVRPELSAAQPRRLAAIISGTAV